VQAVANAPSLVDRVAEPESVSAFVLGEPLHGFSRGHSADIVLLCPTFALSADVVPEVNRSPRQYGLCGSSPLTTAAPPGQYVQHLNLRDSRRRSRQPTTIIHIDARPARAPGGPRSSKPDARGLIDGWVAPFTTDGSMRVTPLSGRQVPAGTYRTRVRSLRLSTSSGSRASAALVWSVLRRAPAPPRLGARPGGRPRGATSSASPRRDSTSRTERTTSDAVPNLADPGKTVMLTPQYMDEAQLLAPDVGEVDSGRSSSGHAEFSGPTGLQPTENPEVMLTHAVGIHGPRAYILPTFNARGPPSLKGEGASGPQLHL
jgi:hypothetical protein